MRRWGLAALVLGACTPTPRPAPPPAVGPTVVPEPPDAGVEAAPQAEPADAAPEAEAVDCDALAGEIQTRLTFGNTCSPATRCMRIVAPCLAPCGMAAPEHAVVPLMGKIEELKARCAMSCGKAKCASWSDNAAVCQAKQCVLPH